MGYFNPQQCNIVSTSGAFYFMGQLSDVRLKSGVSSCLMKSIVIMVTHTIVEITKPNHSASYGIIATFKAIAGHNRKTCIIFNVLWNISAGCIVLMDMMEADEAYPLLAG